MPFRTSNAGVGDVAGGTSNASPQRLMMRDQAHRPEPGLTFADLLTGAAFGALVVVVVLICYVLLCVFLAAFGMPVAA